MSKATLACCKAQSPLKLKRFLLRLPLRQPDIAAAPLVPLTSAVLHPVTQPLPLQPRLSRDKSHAGVMCANSTCKCSSVDTLIAFPELAEESTPFRSMTCLLACDITASADTVDLRRISYPSRCTSDHSTELNN